MVFNLFLFHFRTQIPLPIKLIFIGNSILALAKDTKTDRVGQKQVSHVNYLFYSTGIF